MRSTRSQLPNYLDPAFGKLVERVALPMDTTLLNRIRGLARAENRKYLDQMRYLLRMGVQLEEKRLGIRSRKSP